MTLAGGIGVNAGALLSAKSTSQPVIHLATGMQRCSNLGQVRFSLSLSLPLPPP
eukprot:COSAG03_NODE_422_length_8037_cov_3.643613_1_plen_53_part_10